MTETPPPPPPAPAPPPPPYGQPPASGYGAQPVYAAPPQGYAPAQGYAAVPQGYAAPHGYAAVPTYGADPTAAKNWMNIVALIASISTPFTGVGAILGIVFGHLGLGAVKRGEANNRGMGLAGLIIGYVLVALGVLGTIAYIGVFVWAASSESSY